MPDLELLSLSTLDLTAILKNADVDNLRKLQKYIDAVIVWKQRPEMYLEPIVVTEGDDWRITFAPEKCEDNDAHNS